MNIELYIIKLFFIYNIYNKYYKYIKKSFIKDNSKELSRILEALSIYHNKFPSQNVSSVADLEAFYYACYPIINGKEKTLLDPIFKQLL
jgi:hypothetical protein